MLIDTFSHFWICNCRFIFCWHALHQHDWICRCLCAMHCAAEFVDRFLSWVKCGFFGSSLCAIIYPNSVTGMDFLWGGNPKDHAAAQEDSWKRIREFLKAHLSWYLNRCGCHQDSQFGAFFCTSQLQDICLTTTRMCSSCDGCLHTSVKRCVNGHIPNLNTQIVGAETVVLLERLLLVTWRVGWIYPWIFQNVTCREFSTSWHAGQHSALTRMHRRGLAGQGVIWGGVGGVLWSGVMGVLCSVMILVIVMQWTDYEQWKRLVVWGWLYAT